MNFSQSKALAIAVFVAMLAGCAASSRPSQDSLPAWITNTKLEDGSYYFVNCSADDLDPEAAALVAQSKCLSRAAQLGGVTVVVNGKTVQSLSGTDASESAEMKPIVANVKCEFSDKFLQTLSSGYRVWLRCKARKSDVAERKEAEPSGPKTKGADSSVGRYKRGTVLVSSVPQADKIIVSGARGERVIDVEAVPQSVELREGDSAITLILRKFKNAKTELGEWSHGAVLNKTLYLEQEF